MRSEEALKMLAIEAEEGGAHPIQILDLSGTAIDTFEYWRLPNLVSASVTNCSKLKYVHELDFPQLQYFSLGRTASLRRWHNSKLNWQMPVSSVAQLRVFSSAESLYV